MNQSYTGKYSPMGLSTAWLCLPTESSYQLWDIGNYPGAQTDKAYLLYMCGMYRTHPTVTTNDSCPYAILSAWVWAGPAT